MKKTQEEKERQKIIAQALQSILELSNVTNPKPPEPEQILPECDSPMSEEFCCEQCGYPFKDKHEMNLHNEKHKVHMIKLETLNIGHPCAQEFISCKEFRNHIRIIHMQQFNCTGCDLQGSS